MLGGKDVERRARGGPPQNIVGAVPGGEDDLAQGHSVGLRQSEGRSGAPQDE